MGQQLAENGLDLPHFQMGARSSDHIGTHPPICADRLRLLALGCVLSAQRMEGRSLVAQSFASWRDVSTCASRGDVHEQLATVWRLEIFNSFQTNLKRSPLSVCSPAAWRPLSCWSLAN
jgi:hypothetical protein